jgi:hypothetical protein
MKSVSLAIVLLYSTFLFANNSNPLKMVEKIKLNISNTQIEKVIGKIQKKKDYIFVENEYYEFRKYKNDSRMYLTLKKLKSLKFFNTKKFTIIETLFDGDIVLGSLIGVPNLGIYMEVYNGGFIKKIYWKTPWNEKEKLNYEQVLKKIGEVKIEQN